LRHDESVVIDRETEEEVERWVRLGDEVVQDGKTRVRRVACVRCGSTNHVLGNEPDALCARCYLERGEATGDRTRG